MDERARELLEARYWVDLVDAIETSLQTNELVDDEGRLLAPRETMEEPFGDPPAAVVRRCWLAKYNGDTPDGADPAADFPWNRPAYATQLSWLSSTDRPRTRPVLAEMHPGDLVFVQDVPAGTVVGLWAVIEHLSWQGSSGEVEHEIYSLPVKKFETAVPIRATQRKEYLLEDVEALSRKHQAKSRLTAAALSWGEAFQFAAACGVPGWSFTEPDVYRLMARLSHVRCGPTKTVIDYITDNRAKYEHNTAVERAAEHATEEWYRSRGFAVSLAEKHIMLLGFDAFAVNPETGAEHELEIKGTAGKKIQAHRLEVSQWDRAVCSAQHTPGRWRVAVLTRALAMPPDPLQQLDDTDVAADPSFWRP